MNTNTPAAASPAIPDDNPGRELAITNPDSPDARHISLAGDTYTILVTGEQTNSRYCLIDMHVPNGGGPPPHRHDCEEMFTVLDGSVDFTFRGTSTTVPAGSTVNIPANASHRFRNNSGKPARLLCPCSPAGQEDFFTRVGDPVESRTAPPPPLSPEEQDELRQRALNLAPQYATELLPGDDE